MLTIIEEVMIVVGHDADVVSFFGAMMMSMQYGLLDNNAMPLN